jgi:hypothetical protein
MLEKLWGFQPWGDNPPLRSYYPIVLQSSSARFAVLCEGLRVRSERAESVGHKIGGRVCRGVALCRPFQKLLGESLYGEGSGRPYTTLHGYTLAIQLGTGFEGARRPLVVLATRPSTSGPRDYWWPRVRSRLNAELINARCVKACGKLPSASPCELVCSA